MPALFRRDEWKVTAPCLALPLLGHVEDLKPVLNSLRSDGIYGGETRVLRGQVLIFRYSSTYRAPLGL